MITEIRSPFDNALLARLDHERGLIEVAIRRTDPVTRRRHTRREIIDLTTFYPELLARRTPVTPPDD